MDKHRPLTLEKVDYAKEQAAQLARLAQSGDMPHLLFYGPSGAGKKTRVMALLRAMFGAGVEKVRPLLLLLVKGATAAACPSARRPSAAPLTSPTRAAAPADATLRRSSWSTAPSPRPLARALTSPRWAQTTTLR